MRHTLPRGGGRHSIHSQGSTRKRAHLRSFEKSSLAVPLAAVTFAAPAAGAEAGTSAFAGWQELLMLLGSNLLLLRTFDHSLRSPLVQTPMRTYAARGEGNRDIKNAV